MPDKKGLEPKEAQVYIINNLGLKDTTTLRNKLAKFLMRKKNGKQLYKPIYLNKALGLIGFTQEDVEAALNDFSTKLLYKAQDVIGDSYSGKKLNIEDFETPLYKFNRIYNKDGTPTQYTKMIKYIEENDNSLEWITQII